MVSIHGELKKQIKFCRTADESSEGGAVGKLLEKNLKNNARSVTVNVGAERDKDPIGYVSLYNSSAWFP